MTSPRIYTFALAALLFLFTGCRTIPRGTVVTMVGTPFGSHMVLQRDTVVPLWGYDRPGRNVTISIGERKQTVRADETGRWQTEIGPFAVGDPFEIYITGTGNLVLRDVVAGEVWLASGQSNMEWPLSLSEGAQQALESADNPNLRILKIEQRTAEIPARMAIPNDGWRRSTGASAAQFSAVAYHFGQQLQRELNVPVGIVSAAWGGSPMEAWVPLETLSADPLLASNRDLYERYLRTKHDPQVYREFQIALLDWKRAGGKDAYPDPGDEGEALGWHRPRFDDSDWDTMTIPAETQVALWNFDGVAWFRKTVELPEAWRGRELTVELGMIDDMDVTYLNGVEVGHTGKGTPGFWAVKRRYCIAPVEWTPGEHTIAVRMFDSAGAGGMLGPAENMSIGPEDALPSERIPLTGVWKYRRSVTFPQKPVDPTVGAGEYVSILYNGMIAPLVPMRFRGVIWYQGESNAARAGEYVHLSRTMIADWRRRFENQFPFLYVQLAGWAPGGAAWASLMWAQTRVLEVPGTAMVTALDLGDEADIHPRNKQPVGERLVRAALATVYGRDIVYSGPRIASAHVRGTDIHIQFESTGSGLIDKNGGDNLAGFEVADPEGFYLPAPARISGNEVIIDASRIKNPTQIRHAWNGHPNVELYNREGLPAGPFEWEVGVGGE